MLAHKQRSIERNVTGIEDVSLVKNHETLNDYGMDSFTTKEVEKVIEKYDLKLEGDLKDTTFGTLRQVFMRGICRRCMTYQQR